MFLRRFFQTGAAPTDRDDPSAAAAVPASQAETATVRRIVGRLEAMPPDQARFVACVAYVIVRAANADMTITDAETAYMEQALREYAGIDEAQAVLIVEMAKLQTLAVGGTEDFLVTREFRQLSTPEQRLRVLRACLAVTAVDDSITSAESAVIDEIANELDIPAVDLTALRSEFADRFEALRAMRGRSGA